MNAEILKYYGPCPVHPCSWHHLTRPCIRCLIKAATVALLHASLERPSGPESNPSDKRTRKERIVIESGGIPYVRPIERRTYRTNQ